MSILPSRLLTTVIALTILVPSVILSQVKIKEKVEIKPGTQRPAPRIARTYDFYSPPLFVGNTFMLTLNSSLAFSGTVSVSNDIGYAESVEVGCVFHDPFNPSVIYDTALAWKGRQPIGWGGNLYQGERTVPLICNRGTVPPEVKLLLGRSGFDGFGEGHITGDGSHISYSFTGTRAALDGSTLAVTGTAFISGSSLTSARFSGWKIESEPYIQCRGASVMRITPLDSSGSVYSPYVGSDTLRGSFTVSLRANGNYAYLQGAGQEGSQVTMSIPQWDECELMLDTQRGEIPGGVDTAFVTVTGGGRSATHKVILLSYGLHFDFGDIQDMQHGEIRQLRAAIQDGCSNDVDYAGVHYYKFELLGNSLAWGALRDTLTGKSGAVLDSMSSTRIEFDAWGMNPESPTEVTIRVSVDDGSIPPVTASFMVMPAQMRAILGKKVLSYGDTTSLKIQIQNPDGSWMDKPAEWTGTYTVVQADTFGFLYNPDSSKVGRVITDTSPILIYYARPESEPDSVEVLIQLNLEEPPPPFPFGRSNSLDSVSMQAKVVAPQPKVGGGLVKRPPAKVLGGVVPGGAIHFGLERLVLKKGNEILLGETKFYEAYIDDNNGSKLAIKELEETNQWTGPELEVDFTVVPVQGDKLGVYYESRDRQGAPLTHRNLIRLVGRYWEQDNPYKVKLTATYNGQTATKDIEVKKPARLFDAKVFDKPYNTTQNIKNAALNIDSLCIWYGGRIGIPPQVIKGQMFQEVDKSNNRFNPTYRYEPWADDRFARGKHAKEYSMQPFWVTGTGSYPMGEGKPIPVPPDHDQKNVKPVYYQLTAMNIADYAIANWTKLYWNSADFMVVANSSLTTMWRRMFRDYFAQYLISRPPIPVANPDQRATTDLFEHLRKRYTAQAQTRKAASYGLIQMLYTTAILDILGFNKGKSIQTSSAPEELNDETIEMPFYQMFTLRNLQLDFEDSGNEGAIVPEAKWPKGWEQTWMDSFVNYNQKSGYSESVFNHARKFSPQEK